MTGKEASRRHFLKKTIAGGAAVVATAGISKKVVDLAVEKTEKGSDTPYLSSGERVLSERQYVEMSSSEKATQVKMFVDNYKYESA